MKLTKCVNGHFYDEEKFEVCPHCAGGSKLDVNAIFGGTPSAPKPAMSKVEQDDDMTVPLEWSSAETPQESMGSGQSAVAVPEQEAASKQKDTGASFDISSQPDFDTPLDFDASSSVDAKKEELTEEPQEEMELLSKYNENQTQSEDSVVTEEPEPFVSTDTEPTGEPEPFVSSDAEPTGEPFASPDAEVAEEPEPFVSSDAEPTGEPEPFVSWDAEPTGEPEPFTLPDTEPMGESEPFTLPDTETPAQPETFAAPGTETSVEPEPSLGIPTAWEMPQPSVEEIPVGDSQNIPGTVNPELEDKPTEIVDEVEMELVGEDSVPTEPAAVSEPFASEGPSAMPGGSDPFVPTEPSAMPGGSDPFVPTEPSAMPGGPEPFAPTEPSAMPGGPEPFAPTEPSAMPGGPEPFAPTEPSAMPGGSEPFAPTEPSAAPDPFVPIETEFGEPETAPTAESPVPTAPSPAAAMFGASTDDDDDEHTVAFYDEIFVSKAPSAPVIPQETETPGDLGTLAGGAVSGPSASIPVSESEQFAEETGKNDRSAEPEVFTAPPLKPAQSLPTPCVGWLIALNGTHIGQDFHLRVGKNYIGRDTGMDIALTGDKSVSRNKHAIVTYEPKHHNYFIQPGESNELVYVNDEVVLLPMPLKPYDLIVIGDIELWFMPLCDDQHNWSEVIRKLQEQMNPNV